MKLVPLLSGLAAVALAADVSGQPSSLQNYFAADSTTNPTLAPDENAPNITGDVLAAGTGITPGPDPILPPFSGATYTWTGFDPSNASGADAIADDEVFTFGFDVDSLGVDLTEVGIGFNRQPDGPDDFELLFSVNGGANQSVLTQSFGGATGTINVLGIDLSAVPDLQVGDSIVFTLAPFNSSSDTATLSLQNFSAFGSPALFFSGVVPEPASIALLAAGGLALLHRRPA